jgi:hypothetical protein
VLGQPLDDENGNDTMFVFHAEQTQLEFMMDVIVPNAQMGERREGREDLKDTRLKLSSPGSRKQHIAVS